MDIMAAAEVAFDGILTCLVLWAVVGGLVGVLVGAFQRRGAESGDLGGSVPFNAWVAVVIWAVGSLLCIL